MATTTVVRSNPGNAVVPPPAPPPTGANPPADYGAGSAGGGFGSLATGFSGSIGNANIDSGFEWRRAQGQKGLERSAAHRGTLMTGGSLADLMDYNQGLASQEYANAWDRAYREWMGNAGIAQNNRATTIGAYQGLMNAGLSGAGGYSNAANEATYGGANAGAAGRVAQGSPWGTALQQAGNVGADAALWYDATRNRPPATDDFTLK